MARLYKRVGRMLDRREIKRPDTATVYEFNGDRVDIRIGNSPNVLRYVPVIGDFRSLNIGDRVNIQWELKDGASGYTPVVMAQADYSGGSVRTTSEMFPDGQTIEYSSDGLRVRLGSITQAHLDTVYATEGHVHEDSLSAHGWQIDDNGTIFTSCTYIHPNGQISLGVHPNIIKLDSQHGVYRLWAGSSDPYSAPFAVKVDGAIHSTLGDIANWTIGTYTITADSGNIELNSGSPYGSIRLGATGFDEGNGFWVGRNAESTPAYWLFLGSSTGNKLTWSDGVLDITGTIHATLGEIGGWSIGATSLYSGGDASRVELSSAGTHAIWAGATYPADAPFSVTHYGELKASAGTIGGWTLGTSRLSSTNIYIDQAGQYISMGQYTPHDLMEAWVYGSVMPPGQS